LVKEIDELDLKITEMVSILPSETQKEDASIEYINYLTQGLVHHVCTIIYEKNI
jgi:hypothetical protein